MYTPLLASAASIAFLVVACGVAWFFPSLFFVPCGFSSTTRVSPNGGDWQWWFRECVFCCFAFLFLNKSLTQFRSFSFKKNGRGGYSFWEHDSWELWPEQVWILLCQSGLARLAGKSSCYIQGNKCGLRMMTHVIRNLITKWGISYPVWYYSDSIAFVVFRVLPVMVSPPPLQFSRVLYSSIPKGRQERADSTHWFAPKSPLLWHRMESSRKL